MSGFFMEVFNFFCDPIKKYVLNHLCYIIQVGDNVKALTTEAGILENQRKDVLNEIKREAATMKKPTETVEGWLKRVDELKEAAESVQTGYDNRNCMFLGTCSFNCVFNHNIGRQATKELARVQQEMEFIRKVEKYTTEVPPPAVQIISTLPVEFGRETFELQLNQALNFLRKDDELGTLGIYGMGGVGKTTLLQHINNRLETDLFDSVVFVTASRDCTIEKIQSQIVEKLGLPREGNLTTFITNYLGNKSFAILLDDVWKPLPLEKAGIPLSPGTDRKYKRKLILTSRFENVCYQMGPRPSTPIKVEVLGPEDARLLFRSRVGEEIVSSDQTIRELADKAADLCGGLPVALNAIGRTMARTSDVEVWKNALDELRESKSKFLLTRGIAGTDDDPLPLLKFSYDQLKDPMQQQCFLHCALWPEDKTIGTEKLIRCWMGHGLLGELDDVEKAYRKGHFVIDSLQKACLLESGWREKGVKVHDVIRDMALWIARDLGENEKKWLVLSGDDGNEAAQDERLWNQAEKISIPSSSFSCLPTKIQITSPKLTTLILTWNWNLTHTGLSILRYLHTLKYLDLSDSCLEEFPIEICGLTKLEYLNLSGSRIQSLPVELKALVNLKFLLLRWSDIHSMPDELLSNLVSLLELDLFSPFNSKSQSAVINQLDILNGRLKTLSINVSSVSEFQKLAGLSGISITALWIHGLRDLTSHSLPLTSPHFLGSQHMHSKLKELYISTPGSSLEEIVIEGRCNFPTLDTLYIAGEKADGIKGLKEIIWKGVEPGDVFPRLRVLFIEKSQLEHVTWILKLPCLESLCLENCENMEQLVVWEHAAETQLVPRLVRLKLRNLCKLSRICDGELTFPSLESFVVSSCPGLKKLPFHSPNSCNKIRSIYGKKEWWESLVLEDNMRNFLQPFFLEYGF